MNKALNFGRDNEMQLSIVNLSNLNPESRLDSEYYKPEALAVEAKIMSIPHWLSGKIFDVYSGPFGSTVTIDKYDQNTNCRYVRGKDVKDFFIDDSDPVNIQSALFDSLPQHHLKPLDILVTVVGMNFGISALVFPEDCPAIFSCKSSLIRNVKINPFYLITYFSSKYGYALIRRGQRGAAQPGINLFDLRNIPIPIVSDDFQNKIEKIVIESKERMDASKKYYSEAKHSLLSELGLHEWKPVHTPNYIRNYSQVGLRIDAEYFQPKFQEMFNMLSSDVELNLLGKLTTYTKGIEVGSKAYVDTGIPFWRVSNITKYGLDDGGANFISEDLYNELRSTYEPQNGEILLTKDATPGLAFYLEIPIIGIISGGILRLEIIDDIPPHYLELALNSIFVQMQIERDVVGSVIKHWKPSEVNKTYVPRLSDDKEKEIALSIQQSHATRREARALQEKAKRAVEIAIEDGEEAAISYLTK